MRYLIFGVDTVFRSSLHAFFPVTHHTVEFVNRVEDAEQLLRFDEFDGALFGVDDFDRVAIGLVRSLRLNRCTTPVLLIGTAIDAATAERWLQTVDDVIRLPVDVREVVARMGAAARRALGAAARRALGASATVNVQNVAIHIVNETVRVDGQLVHLTRSEFQILASLAARLGRVAGKDYLLSAMYSDRSNEPETKILDVFICKLRKKLTDAGAPKDLIQTVWGRGWSIKEPFPGVEAHVG